MYITGADPENFSRGSKLPTLNLNKQKKKTEAKGEGLVIELNKSFLCDCLAALYVLFST